MAADGLHQPFTGSYASICGAGLPGCLAEEDQEEEAKEPAGPAERI